MLPGWKVNADKLVMFSVSRKLSVEELRHTQAAV